MCMKDFLKYVSATVVGIIVFMVIVGALGVMSIIGMVASGSSAKDVADNTVFVVKLNGQLAERSDNDIFSQILGDGGISTIGLDDLLDGIKKAKDNDKIKGIYIEAGAFAPDSYASMQAVRTRLVCRPSMLLHSRRAAPVMRRSSRSWSAVLVRLRSA